MNSKILKSLASIPRVSSIRGVRVLNSKFNSKIPQFLLNHSQTIRRTVGFGVFGSAIFGSTIFAQDAHHPTVEVGKLKDGLPFYTKEDVEKHKTKESGIWVTYKNGVYDITEFIEQHPGGAEKIILAAGGSIEPFWALYGQHMEDVVFEILESLRIGNIKEPIAIPTMGDNLYANEPLRSPVLVTRSQKPYNAETPMDFIAEKYLTPNSIFYVRNHLPVPKVDAESYNLEITADNLKTPVKISLKQLQQLPQIDVVATIQCAGNRRNEMTKYKSVRGGSWDAGAISNAKWTGVKLTDVMKLAGVMDKDGKFDNSFKHVQFEGIDTDKEKNYGASIPVDKALHPEGDVILALKMNDETLPVDHGFPVRLVAPGIVGARNVKWLGKIHASKEESKNHWQQNDYKGFSPNIDWHNVDFSAMPAIQELPVQSAIALPKPGQVVPQGQPIHVKGYAWSGGGRGIVRVDVSPDGGNTWTNAKLATPEQPRNKVWAWTLWEADVELPEKFKEPGTKLDLVCRAVDSQYNIQPESAEKIWNLRGVLNNSWHRVPITIKTPNQ
jgi:sulfite oxidase